MYRFLFLVAIVFSSPTFADRSMENCKNASAWMTRLVVGGASEEFARRRFADYFGTTVFGVDRVVDTLLTAIYVANGEYANLVTNDPFGPKPINNVIILVEKNVCTFDRVRKDWR